MDEVSQTKLANAAKTFRAARLKASQCLQKCWRSPRNRFLFSVSLCFLLCTPVTAMFCSGYSGFGGILILGAVGSGCALAKIFAKRWWLFWTLGIVISLCILAIYGFSFVLLAALAATLGCGC